MTPEPKPRGRPRNAPGAGKLARVEVRTTHERKAKLERLAGSAGVSLSVWVEREIDKAREPA